MTQLKKNTLECVKSDEQGLDWLHHIIIQSFTQEVIHKKNGMEL